RSKRDWSSDVCSSDLSGGVTDVTAVAMAQNGGTVRNILNTAQAVQTRWVLTLSPGDYLYDAGTVSWWLERLRADTPRAAFAKQADRKSVVEGRRGERG